MTNIEDLKKAVEMTCERMNECLLNFKNFKTEKDVKDFLNNGMELAFDTIVASGKNASEPHYAGNEELHNGFCVIDFGARYNRMCADVTRTVYIGEPSEEEVRLYNYLLKEHYRMLKMVKVNVKMRYVEKCFRRRLGDKRKLFIHALCHGLGKEVHEEMNRKLKKGDVITVEPGLYQKDEFGIRIEDDVVVGSEVLSNGVTRKLLSF